MLLACGINSKDDGVCDGVHTFNVEKEVKKKCPSKKKYSMEVIDLCVLYFTRKN